MVLAQQQAGFAFAGPLAPPTYLSDWSSWDLGIPTIGGGVYDAGVPRIADSLFDGVAFQYRTADEARARTRLGGSSFLVGRPLAGSEALFGHVKSVPYLISNRHVVHDGGASVASLNRRDGGEPDIFELDPNEWHAHPDGEDLAAACPWPRLNTEVHRISHIRESDFVTPAVVEEYDLGVGEEVFMIGRFLNHQGERVNRPAARFGSISMMLEDIHISGPLAPRVQNSFAVEMRSRTGFSGSPVCVYRTMATVLTDVPEGKHSYWGLLGVNWGHILDEDGENTWLNGVVPAWKISELLNVPPLQAIHSLAEQTMSDLAAQSGVVQSGAVEDVAETEGKEPPTKDENPQHKEDFNRLLDAALTGPESKDQT